MTPARRAAIKKAQLASARKRRKRRIVAGSTVGVVAVTLAAGGGMRHGRKVRQRKYDAATLEFLRQASHPQLSLPVATGKKQDVTTFGKTRSGGGVIKDKNGQQRGNKKGAAGRRVKGEAAHAIYGRRVFKVDSVGTARSIKRSRGVYDNGRRWGYDSKARHKKYLEVDKPLRQRQAQERRRAKGGHG